MILCNFISLRAFSVYMENPLRFEISLRSIRTEVSFILPEVMWTLILKLPYTEVKFHPEVKSQTGLSSLQVSCKRALTFHSSLICRFHQSRKTCRWLDEQFRTFHPSLHESVTKDRGRLNGEELRFMMSYLESKVFW